MLQRIFVSKMPANARVLDVCCGTGYLARLLVSRGLRVTGIDVSAEMVGCARRNVAEAEFLVADCRDFHLPGRFHGAVSTFDSLNHVLTMPDLERVFCNVHQALRRGGLFAFDMLLEEAYRTRWADNFALVRDDHVLAITGNGFHETTRLAECRITMFRLDGNVWQRSDITVTERCYTAQEITQALDAAGFTGINLYDARDLGMQGDLGEGRVFVTAQRADKRLT